MKSLIAEAQKRSLRFYNRNLPLTVQADASKHGLGAALLQQGQPVAFASKSLSDTEKRYANIERELLSVVFACERFQTYLLGREFTIGSDHKPLEMIALKNLVAAPPRLQRMLLRLQPFDCNIKYKPGKEMLLADALSRLPSPANTTIELDMRIDHHGFTTERIRQIETETATDTDIVHSLQLSHWMDGQQGETEFLALTRQYWDQQDELSIDNGLLMKGPRIVIPGCQRERTLTQPAYWTQRHYSHVPIGQKCCILAWDRCRHRRLRQQMPSLPRNQTKQQMRTYDATHSSRWTIA